MKSSTNITTFNQNDSLQKQQNATISTDLSSSQTKKNGIFLLSVTGIASVMGFGYAFMMAKRNEMKEITSKNTPQEVREQMTHMKAGTRLASRALIYSWVCSIGGVSLLSYTAWKLSGASDLGEFRRKAGEALPRIPKSEEQGRNNFRNLKDLADYLVSEDEKKKAASED